MKLYIVVDLVFLLCFGLEKKPNFKEMDPLLPEQRMLCTVVLVPCLITSTRTELRINSSILFLVHEKVQRNRRRLAWRDGTELLIVITNTVIITVRRQDETLTEKKFNYGPTQVRTVGCSNRCMCYSLQTEQSPEWTK